MSFSSPQKRPTREKTDTARCPGRALYAWYEKKPSGIAQPLKFQGQAIGIQDRVVKNQLAQSDDLVEIGGRGYRMDAGIVVTSEVRG